MDLKENLGAILFQGSGEGSQGQAKTPLTPGGSHLRIHKGVPKASLRDTKHGGARRLILLPQLPMWIGVQDLAFAIAATETLIEFKRES